MRAYFIRLFDYDRYANQVILKTIIDAGAPEKPVLLMAHLLAAQQVWYNRCKDLPPFGGALWPDAKVDAFEQLITGNSDRWLSFLNETDDTAFDKEIDYHSTKGDSFSNTLSDILTQVINHGTHHRAQIGQLLKVEGVNLPITDYIFYLRQIKS